MVNTDEQVISEPNVTQRRADIQANTTGFKFSFYSKQKRHNENRTMNPHFGTATQGRVRGIKIGTSAVEVVEPRRSPDRQAEWPGLSVPPRLRLGSVVLWSALDSGAQAPPHRDTGHRRQFLSVIHRAISVTKEGGSTLGHFLATTQAARSGLRPQGPGAANRRILGVILYDSVLDSMSPHLLSSPEATI